MSGRLIQIGKREIIIKERYEKPLIPLPAAAIFYPFPTCLGVALAQTEAIGSIVNRNIANGGFLKFSYDLAENLASQ